MKLTPNLTALTLALSITSTAFGLEEGAEVDVGFEENGKIEVDGETFKERGPVTTYLYAEVEKSIPSPDGDVILYLRPTEFRQPNQKDVTIVDAIKLTGEAKPFAHNQNTDWKMYDAEGQPTDDPSFAFRVLMPSPTEGDARAFDVKWNECEGNMTGNFNGYGCSKKRFLSDDYTAYLRANLFQCVNAGLDRIGGGSASKVHLVHNGTAGDTNHSSKSLHGAGRAVDVQIMRVTSANQKRDFVFKNATNNPSGTERKFYLGFRACWHAKQEKRQCKRKRDPGGTGTIGWEDSRHHHHLHISMPFCPNNKGHFITDEEFIRAAKTKNRVPASKKK